MRIRDESPLSSNYSDVVWKSAGDESNHSKLE